MFHPPSPPVPPGGFFYLLCRVICCTTSTIPFYLLSQAANDWVLRSERGPHDCPLDGVGLFPAGYTLRVWALARPPADGEFSCGFESEIWNNSESDPAVLLAPGGIEVSRR